eukprot:6247118-Prymnesium_polylepis.1
MARMPLIWRRAGRACPSSRGVSSRLASRTAASCSRTSMASRPNPGSCRRLRYARPRKKSAGEPRHASASSKPPRVRGPPIITTDAAGARHLPQAHRPRRAAD